MNALLLPLIAPAISKLADIVRALKEPLGKQGVDQLRNELQQALENVNTVLEQHTSFSQAVAAEITYLNERVEYLELPFLEKMEDSKAQPAADRIDFGLAIR